MHSTNCFTSGRLCSAALAWWKDEEGVTAIEYALVGSLILLVCVGSITALSGALNEMYDTWSKAVIKALGG